MILFLQILLIFYKCYMGLIFIRIIGSWIPQLSNHELMRFVAFWVDPYLNAFRRFIPPIGGVLDISPILGIFILSWVKNLLVSYLIQFS